MGKTLVRSAKRYFDREMMNRFDGDLSREIAELITNSLDSYGRIQGFQGKKIVRIELDKAIRKSAEKKVIRVIDNAEGMTRDVLVKIFSERGADNNGGVENGNIRGLFGLGASDVMAASAVERKSAEYCSFKDGEVTILRFGVNEEENNITIEDTVITDSERIKNLREKYHIPENGTVATFGVPDSVVLPETIEELKHSIETMYLLRYVLADDNIEVNLSAYGKTVALSSKPYTLPDPFMKDVDLKFKFKGREFRGTISFYKNEDKDRNPTDILVQDDRRNLYDNQMFGYNRAQGSEQLSGILVLHNFWNELDYFLNEKKMSLLKDDRTGFDIYKQFGKLLVQALDSPIRAALQYLLKENGVKNISLSSTKNYAEFLRILNQDLRNSNSTPIGSGGTDADKAPPVAGLEFARENISITVNRQYDLKIYINKELIHSGDIITIAAVGNNGNISFTNEILLGDDDLVDDIPVKSCTITALLETSVPVELFAKCGSCSARCGISVIQENIVYPENGIQFEKSEVTFAPDVKHNKVKLYFDTTKVKPQDEILITDNSKGKLTCSTPQVSVSSGTMITDTIGYLSLEFFGGDLKDKYIVVASCKKGNDQLEVKIDVSKPSESSKSGDISGYDFDSGWAGNAQSYFDIRTKKVMIVTQNEMNKTFIKEFKPNISGKALLYAISLVSFQAAKLYADKEKSAGHLAEDDIEGYLEIVEKKKNEYYNKFLCIENK